MGLLLYIDIINVEFPFLTAHEQAIVPWIDDRDVKLCPTCAKNFHVTRRKHHCRLCGAIMCHDCTQFLPLTLASMFFFMLRSISFKPVTFKHEHMAF
jgi:rabenosyn-5